MIEKRPLSVPMTVLGILFMLGWMGAHYLWAFMLLLGGTMANDSGAASTEVHSALIMRLMVGAGLAGLAGIPGGLAFFLRGRRKLLIWSAVALFIVGALCQVWGFVAFSSAVSRQKSAPQAEISAP